MVVNVQGNNSFTAPATAANIVTPAAAGNAGNSTETGTGVVLDIRDATNRSGNGQTSFIGVSGTLDFVGSIIGLAQNNTIEPQVVVKVGAGTLRTSGASANSNTGTTFILNGTYEVNKTPGVDGIRGPVIVGDNINSATLKLDGNQQLQNLGASNITVNATGKIDASGQLATASEQQILTLGSASAGSFTISFAGQTTSTLPFNASAAQVQTALQALINIGAGNVLVTNPSTSATIPTSTSVTPDTAGIYAVTFTGALAGMNLDQITVNTASPASGGLVVGRALITAASEAANTVTITSPNAFVPGQSVTISGVSIAGYNGTYTVTTATAASFAYTDPTAGLGAPTFQVSQAVAIGAATEVGNTVSITSAGNTFVAGQFVTIAGITPSGYNGTFQVVTPGTTFTYTDPISGLAASTVAGTAVGGVIANALTLSTTLQDGAGTNNTNTGEVQFISAGGAGATGTFTLTYNGKTTSVAMPAGDSASDVQTQLQSLPNIGAGNVTVTSPSTGNYLVTFTGALAGANQPQITLNSSLSGGTAPATGTITDGGGWDTTDQINAGLAAGTYTLTLNGIVSPAIAFNASQQQIQAIIEAMLPAAFPTIAGVGPGSVIVTQMLQAGAAGGAIPTQFDVTFTGPLSGMNIAPFVISAGASTQTSIGGSSSQVETINLAGASSGSFTLNYNGQTTAALPFNATPSQIQNALTSLASLGPVAADTVQTITFNAAVTGGTFTLQLNTTVSGAITWTAVPATTATTIQTVVAAMANVGTGNVVVTAIDADHFTVTFVGQLGSFAAEPDDRQRRSADGQRRRRCRHLQHGWQLQQHHRHQPDGRNLLRRVRRHPGRRRGRTDRHRPDQRRQQRAGHAAQRPAERRRHHDHRRRRIHRTGHRHHGCGDSDRWRLHCRADQHRDQPPGDRRQRPDECLPRHHRFCHRNHHRQHRPRSPVRAGRRHPHLYDHGRPRRQRPGYHRQYRRRRTVRRWFDQDRCQLCRRQHRARQPARAQPDHRQHLHRSDHHHSGHRHRRLELGAWPGPRRRLPQPAWSSTQSTPIRVRCWN